mmetsp:Transcript_33169/g.84747  ORF Transcript_33169/g.84747 Transcript_33169/m.84747 type:complete len:207 (+) Transcript_33169:1134-1754(+)
MSTSSWYRTHAEASTSCICSTHRLASSLHARRSPASKQPDAATSRRSTSTALFSTTIWRPNSAPSAVLTSSKVTSKLTLPRSRMSCQASSVSEHLAPSGSWVGQMQRWPFHCLGYGQEAQRMAAASGWVPGGHMTQRCRKVLLPAPVRSAPPTPSSVMTLLAVGVAHSHAVPSALTRAAVQSVPCEASHCTQYLPPLEGTDPSGHA